MLLFCIFSNTECEFIDNRTLVLRLNCRNIDLLDKISFPLNCATLVQSVGPSDFYDVLRGDFRVRCNALEWANHVNFNQPVTVSQIGPRYPFGPTYKRQGIKFDALLRSFYVLIHSLSDRKHVVYFVLKILIRNQSSLSKD